MSFYILALFRIIIIYWSSPYSGSEVINKRLNSAAMICWNKALWLATPCHMIIFNQLECFNLVLHSYTTLKFIYDIGFWFCLGIFSVSILYLCVFPLVFSLYFYTVWVYIFSLNKLIMCYYMSVYFLCPCTLLI